MNKNHYYSLVTDRISELEKELEGVLAKLSDELDYNTRKELELAKEVISSKIKYLKDIESLPLYVSVSSLSKAQIYELESKKHISFRELQHKLGLDKVREIMGRNKVTTLEYLKELFLDDYSSMYELISLQSVNFDCNERIISLYNYGESSIAQLRIKENQLNKLESKTNQVIESLERDYNYDTLKEISYYKRNNEEKLSREFVMKHRDKVIANNPEMKKVLKKMDRNEKFKFITKFFKSKRDKNEEKFINSVIDSYSNDSRLSSLGLSSSDDLLDNSHNIKKFLKKFNSKVSSKRKEFSDLRSDINSVRTSTLNEIKRLENLKEEKRQQFISLLKSKTDFLPKMFGEQLWNEPELKSSLIRFASVKEEKALMNKIVSWNPPTIQVMDDVQEEVNVNVRRLTA